MIESNSPIERQFSSMLDAGLAQISTISPSEWAESKMILPKTGKFSYDQTPYMRRIADYFSPYDPCRIFAFMKGSQIGATEGGIIPPLLWMACENPGPCYYMVGSPDLIESAVNRLDVAKKNAGVSDYFKDQTFRPRNQKTGDTNFRKDFAGGWIKIISANNHKAIAQDPVQYLMLDDLDQIKGYSTEAGSAVDLILVRTRSFKGLYKAALISTPLTKAGSLIEPAYLHGDQQRWMVECPNCHEAITWNWDFPDGKKQIYYELDNHGLLIRSSVGMICPKCGAFHNDRKKMEQLRGGYWEATAMAKEEDYHSHHLSSLYAPISMATWADYVQIYLKCCPPGQPILERSYQTFVNTTLGLTFEPKGDTPDSRGLMSNQGGYAAGTVPEKLSMKQGNGRIVLITCAADINGKLDDARLDYEVLAHSESGSTYSITHGSIGTFKIKDGNKGEDRTVWSYDFNAEHCVWKEFDKIRNARFDVDGDIPRRMQIALAVLDCRYAVKDKVTNKIIPYMYLEMSGKTMLGVMGEKDLDYDQVTANTKPVKLSMERKDLWLITVGNYKDTIAGCMSFNWDRNNGGAQPRGYMNFPDSEGDPKNDPGNCKYNYPNYFKHFETEHRVAVKDASGNTKYRWVKKEITAQNHMFDCRVYNLAARDIIVMATAEQKKEKYYEWVDWAQEARDMIERLRVK